MTTKSWRRVFGASAILLWLVALVLTWVLVGQKDVAPAHLTSLSFVVVLFLMAFLGPMESMCSWFGTNDRSLQVANAFGSFLFMAPGFVLYNKALSGEWTSLASYLCATCFFAAWGIAVLLIATKRDEDETDSTPVVVRQPSVMLTSREKGQDSFKEVTSPHPGCSRAPFGLTA